PGWDVQLGQPPEPRQYRSRLRGLPEGREELRPGQLAQVDAESRGEFGGRDALLEVLVFDQYRDDRGGGRHFGALGYDYVTSGAHRRGCGRVAGQHRQAESGDFLRPGDEL